MVTVTLTPENQSNLLESLSDERWIVACLCAAWCDVCTRYRAGFDELAKRHSDKIFVWIDVEDNADLVGDMEVENFPTLLMQRDNGVVFYGPMVPDVRIAERVLLSHSADADAGSGFQDAAKATAEQRQWQTSANLRQRLNDIRHESNSA